MARSLEKPVIQVRPKRLTYKDCVIYEIRFLGDGSVSILSWIRSENSK